MVFIICTAMICVTVIMVTALSVGVLWKVYAELLKDDNGKGPTT